MSRNLILVRLVAMMLVALLMFVTLLRSIGQLSFLPYFIMGVLGLIGGIYLNIQWYRRKLSYRGLIYWCGLGPFSVALVGFYVFLRFGS